MLSAVLTLSGVSHKHAAIIPQHYPGALLPFREIQNPAPSVGVRCLQQFKTDYNLIMATSSISLPAGEGTDCRKLLQPLTLKKHSSTVHCRVSRLLKSVSRGKRQF